MISLCPNYLHADVSDGKDLYHHQQEVTDGQLVTMSPVPSTVDSDVASECHLCCPPPLPIQEVWFCSSFFFNQRTQILHSFTGCGRHPHVNLWKNYSKPPWFDVLQRPQASTGTLLYAISKFKMMTKSCFYEAKDNILPQSNSTKIEVMQVT